MFRVATPNDEGALKLRHRYPARTGKAEEGGDRTAERRGGRSSCSNPKARGRQQGCVRLRGTRSQAPAQGHL